jgi:peptide/nickel transport system substrate-binding protein
MAPWRECQRGIGARRARALAAGAAVAVAACAPPAPPPPGTLVVAVESAIATLDPRFTTDANSSRVSALVASGLTTTAADADARPDLAASWRELSPTELEFRLRPDARFHDGSPVTAADVVATYRSVADPALASPKRDALAVVEEVSAPDPHTVVFRLARPQAAFLDATTLGILPAALTPTGPVAPEAVVGAGPFRVAGTLPDGGVELAPHAGWMDGPPALARVRFKVVPDGTVRALELASGAVHLVENAVDPDLLPWLGAHDRLRVVIVPGTTFQYLGVNFRDPRLADRRVRRAFAHAVDRAGIARALLRDTARPATGLLAPTHWAYDGDVATYPYDPERARGLLAEAGLVPAARAFSYKTSTVELRRRIAEVFQAEVATVGLRLDVRSYEWATFYEDVRRGRFELFSLAWVGVRDPDIYYRLFHSSMTPPTGLNRGAYANPVMDRLLEEARDALDRPTRRRLYGEIQQLAAEDLPLIPLWWADTVVVQSRALVGFEPEPDGDLRSLARARLMPAAATAATPLDTGAGGPPA